MHEQVLELQRRKNRSANPKPDPKPKPKPNPKPTPKPTPNPNPGEFHGHATLLGGQEAAALRVQLQVAK